MRNDEGASVADEIASAIADRRWRLMVEVTCEILESDPELELEQGVRLIEASREAMTRLAPESVDHFERRVVPRMRELLRRRFGVSDAEVN